MRGVADWSFLTNHARVLLCIAHDPAYGCATSRPGRASPGGPGHFGMIFMPSTYRRTKKDTGRIIAALEAKLAEYPGDEDLANGECWL